MRTHRTYIRTMAAAAAFTLVACAAPNGESQEPKMNRPPAGDPSQIAALSNDAGFDLYRAARADGQDTVISPVSIALAFGMVDAGASGSVGDAIGKLWNLPADHEDRLDAFNALSQAVAAEGAAGGEDAPDHAKVLIANRAFVDDAFTPLQPYQDDLAAYFGAGISRTPMATDGAKAAKDINAWINDNTEGLIPSLVNERNFNDRSRLALANALYLKASWESPFEKDLTTDEPFTLEDGSTADVPTMHGYLESKALEGDGFTAVSVPYAYDELEMLVVVPDEGKLASVEDRLSQDWLDSFDTSAVTYDVTLALPKFKAESTTDLRTSMEQGMGVDGLYDVPALDGIGPDLEVSAALHAATVQVDEEGTEAAAVTVVMVATAAAPADPNPQLELRADQPFLYLIRDVDSGAVLFVGRVLDPR